MDYDNCSCNICGVRMWHQNYKSRDKHCSKLCKQIDSLPSVKKGLHERWRDDAPTGGKANKHHSCFDAIPWPVAKAAHTPKSNRILRIRGIQTKRLTTKDRQND